MTIPINKPIRAVRVVRVIQPPHPGPLPPDMCRPLGTPPTLVIGCTRPYVDAPADRYFTALISDIQSAKRGNYPGVGREDEGFDWFMWTEVVEYLLKLPPLTETEGE